LDHLLDVLAPQALALRRSSFSRDRSQTDVGLSVEF
jgi:hypothetical protein